MTNRLRALSRMRSRYPLAVSVLAVLALVTALSSGAAPATTAAVPTNTALPTVSGNAVQGQTLTASPGSWSGTTPITFAYQWLRCDSTGSSCNSISGETGTTRLVDIGDVGSTLRVTVTATNASGSTSANSNATAVVTSTGSGSGAPVASAVPTISGSAVQGQTLSAFSGTWTGTTPITFAYQWVRCDTSGSNCVDISGETTTTRVVDSGDVGSQLRIRVTASNTAGSTSSTSNATATVTSGGGGGGGSGPPVNSANPTISGTATQGQTLTASTGTWTGKTPITFADQWYRCDSNSNNCSPITGETGATRIVDSGDVGSRLKVRVTATNGSGASAADSSTTAVVTGAGGGGGGDGGGGGGLPAGAITLPDGKISIPATSVPADARLIIDKVKFNPNPIRARNTPIQVSVHIVDTRGYVVRDVLVFVRSVPILTSTPPELATAQNGWAIFQVLPRADFPLKAGYHVQFFVRARRTGDNPLAGVGTRRLVQVRTAAG